MPRQKKKDTELTKDEAMKKLFPKRIRDEAHAVAHEKDKDAKKRTS